DAGARTPAIKRASAPANARQYEYLRIANLLCAESQLLRGSSTSKPGATFCTEIMPRGLTPAPPRSEPHGGLHRSSVALEFAGELAVIDQPDVEPAGWPWTDQVDAGARLVQCAWKR